MKKDEELESGGGGTTDGVTDDPGVGREVVVLEDGTGDTGGGEIGVGDKDGLETGGGKTTEDRELGGGGGSTSEDRLDIGGIGTDDEPDRGGVTT